MEIYEPMIPRAGNTDMLERTNTIGYIFEPKIDGTRVLIYKDKDDIAIFNRKKKDIIALFPEMLDLAAFIKCKSCVLDGEIVVLNARGHPDPDALQSREQALSMQEIRMKRKKTPATVFIFDILEKDEKPLISEVLRKRKLILKEIVKPGPNISLVPYTLDGKDLWNQVQEQRLNGMVAKEANSKYLAGKNWSWLKIKRNNFTDTIISGIETKNEKIISLILSTYDPGTDSFVYSGKVEDIERGQIKLLKRLSSKIITNLPEIKVPGDFEQENKNIIWLGPEIIARIKFKEINQKKEFVNPKISRIRFDKMPRDCVLD